MNVEIINVGTELLLGEIVNTNATLLQKVCRDLGLNVYYQSVVGDNPQRILECLDHAFSRGANCVMTTGGLGPTTDDLTKELSAQYLGLDMVYNEIEASKVEKKCQFCTGLKDIPDNNFKQAYYPKDAYILENDMGTANGCVMSKDEKIIINLPGPPKELKYVVEHSLIPYLERYRQDTIFTYDYLTMFIGESMIDERLRDLIENQDQVSIALYAGEETVRIRLAVKASSKQEAHLLTQGIKAEVEKRLKDNIIEEADMKQALYKIMPPLTIEYKSDFVFEKEFLQDYIQKHAKLHLCVNKRHADLGDIVEIRINDEYYEIPTFVDASYSYQRIESRVVMLLYKYIHQHPDML